MIPNFRDKTKEELIKLLEELSLENNSLKVQYETSLIERAKAEADLEENKEKYRGLSEAAFESIFLSEKGLCIGQNQTAEKIFGYSNEEATEQGRYGTEWIAPEDRDMVMKNMLAGYEEPYEVTALKKDGTRFPCMLRGKMMHYKGKIVRVTSLSDITDRKLVEEAYKSKSSLLEAQSNATIEAVLVIDENQKRILINKRAIELFNIPQEIIENEDDSLLLKHVVGMTKHPEKFLAKVLYLYDHNQESSRDEIEFNNGVILDRYSAPVLGKDGKNYGRIWTFHDITDQKRAEKDLIKSKEKAEESDRLKSAFLANMSHEIRTPMNGILGFADLLKEPKLTGEKQQEYIKIIQKSGLRMLNIINDIVDISKIESGQVTIKMSETNINDQVEFIYNFFKPEIDKKGILFSKRTTLQGKDAIIYCDQEKLYAILANLVKNAIKFTSLGVIEFGYELKTKSNNSLLEFFIRDTGIGIPIHRQEAVFERFIQAEIVDKMAHQGAGLGLSISKAYVELLGGKIWLKSDLHIGSTFYFTIPYNTEIKETLIVEEKILPLESKNNLPNMKILIAEDDEISMMLVSIAVNTFCNNVIEVGTGTAAVEACKNNPDIDLILMDIQMPEMNGYEATKKIREFNKDVVIIAQTAFALTFDKNMALEAGCNDSLSKPIIQDELLAMINKHMKS
ncbi:MAG: response regulator [Bacteroidetes bacterium]|nr:response regulator [Bacteroidota bacterium]